MSSVHRLSAPAACLMQPSAGFDGSTISGLLLADGLKQHGWRTFVCFGRPGPMIERYAAAGHDVRVLRQRNWLRSSATAPFSFYLAAELLAARSAWAEIRRLRPHLVYLNSLVCLPGAIAAARLGLPAVWHLRELFADIGGEMRAPGFARRTIARTVLRLSRRQVVISRAVAQSVFGSIAANATLIPNAGGPAYDTPPQARTPADRSRLGLDLQDPVLGVPGTLRPSKGHPRLFAALPSVLREFPRLQIAVTGCGDQHYAASLAGLAQRLGLGDRVRFLGAVTDMPAFYRACDAVCVPSRNEAFGRVVIEAFASGVPLAASRAGGIAEIVRDGQTGLLFDYDDPVGLAAALVSLLRSPDLRSRLTSAARTCYVEHYNTARYAAAVHAVALSALSHSPGGTEPHLEHAA